AMKLPRRLFLQSISAAAAASALPQFAAALDYPTRPIRLIVGFPQGGVTDLGARIIGDWLAQRFSQTVVVENKPGASTQLAAEAVANAPPDGCTLLMASATNAINVALSTKHDYDFIRDIAPVAGILRFPLVLEAHPSLPVKTVGELIAYARAHPGQITLAS